MAKLVGIIGTLYHTYTANDKALSLSKTNYMKFLYC